MRFIILGLLLLFCRCSGPEKPRAKSVSDFFKELKQIEFLELKSMEISETDLVKVSYPASVEISGVCGVFVEKTMSSDNFHKDSLMYATKSRAIRLLNDDCNLFVGDEIPLKQGCNSGDFFPVPGIRNKSFKLKKFNLDLSSKVFFGQFAEGNYFNDQYEFRDLHLPEEVRHGYSTGVVITHDQRIVHWLIVW